MKRAVIMVTISLVLASSGVSAHGDSHNKKDVKKPAVAEQKVFGRSGDPKKVSRTIEITMTDAFRYSPAEIKVKRGETLRLVAKNSGQIMHEIVLGTMKELKEHAELMKKFPEMEHEEPHMAHVKPGGKEGIVWHFNRAGEFYYGCLIPGHFEAGMIGKITVTAK